MMTGIVADARHFYRRCLENECLKPLLGCCYCRDGRDGENQTGGESFGKHPLETALCNEVDTRTQRLRRSDPKPYQSRESERTNNLAADFYIP